MRILLVAVFTLISVNSVAQQPAPQPAALTWQSIQALRPGAKLYVHTKAHTTSCSFKSADNETLVCAAGKDVAIPRAEIVSIKASHRVLSAAVGAAIGAGIGAGVGAGMSGCPSSGCIGITRGQVAELFGAALAIVGAIVGALTDFIRTTIYVAP